MLKCPRKDVICVDEKAPLASEMYEELKQATKFREKLIYILICIILALVVALVVTNLYHIHQWSQFDTFVVDTSGGDGNANLIQGDNTGGVFNGTDRSEDTQGQEVQGEPDQADRAG